MSRNRSSKNENSPDVVVFGGLVRDIIAKGINPDGNQQHTSNIGKIEQMWGGTKFSFLMLLMVLSLMILRRRSQYCGRIISVGN